MSPLHPYILSLTAGLAIGVIYGLISVRSPAPPIIALLGLLGMLAGEACVQWLRGHASVVQSALHAKTFAHPFRDGSAKDADADGTRGLPQTGHRRG
ncbi:DUF1427 family protein [Roseovarius sp. B08]|uniref:DUF1427 family protein n=1 Tax=Roseovarius sp. B08 TaxID=3449223 RepID=UPI003EDC3AE5